jgi:hypothetical protein
VEDRDRIDQDELVRVERARVHIVIAPTTSNSMSVKALADFIRIAPTILRIGAASPR